MNKLINWDELTNSIQRTAKRAARKLYHWSDQAEAIQELLHVGLIAVVERGAGDLHPNIQRTIARRAMWDYGVREQVPVSLPKDSQYRTRAALLVRLGELQHEHVQHEETTIMEIEIRQAYHALPEKERVLWKMSMMGYTTQEIALQHGYTSRSVSTLMSRAKKSLRLPYYWQTRKRRPLT